MTTPHGADHASDDEDADVANDHHNHKNNNITHHRVTIVL